MTHESVIDANENSAITAARVIISVIVIRIHEHLVHILRTFKDGGRRPVKLTSLDYC